MTDPSEYRIARRMDRLVSDLLAGKRLSTRLSDVSEGDTIRLAAQLAGSRVLDPYMTAAFKQRLAKQLTEGEPDSRITRRMALAAAASAASGVALGASIERTVGAPLPSDGPRPAHQATVVTPGWGRARWVDLGLTLEDLEEGVPRRASAGAIQVFVVRRGPTVTAVSALCTHQPCELIWNAGVGALECPCHGARFSSGGASVSPNYPLPPLPLARARVRDGRVEVLGTGPWPR